VRRAVGPLLRKKRQPGFYCPRVPALAGESEGGFRIMAVNHEELLETIGNMTVIELSEFVDAFKEKFNVTAMAAAPAAAMPGAGAAAEVAEEKDEFDVVLEGVGDKKIQVIKVVREVTSLGLKEAKDLVDNAPGTVKEAATKDEAEQIKAKLEEVGATVVLK
jgi:large subunit ribosomal protein L7/L12